MIPHMILENVDQKLGVQKPYHPPSPLCWGQHPNFFRKSKMRAPKGVRKKVLLLLRAMCLYFTLLMRRQEVRK